MEESIVVAEYVPDSGWLILYANAPARKMFGLGLIDFGTKVYGSVAALDAVEFSDDAAGDEPERAARDRALQAGLAELLERSPLPAEASAASPSAALPMRKAGGQMRRIACSLIPIPQIPTA